MCSVCHSYNPVLSSFMTYHRICNKNSITGATIGAWTAYTSGALDFISVFSGDHVAQSLVFCVVFWRSLFVLLSLFFWPLHCLSLEVRLLIIPLVYWHFSSYNRQNRPKLVIGCKYMNMKWGRYSISLSPIKMSMDLLMSNTAL